MTLLVVDDDQDVLRYIRALLERDGHRVIPACDGSEGLALAHVHGKQVDLLLTDMCMPGLGGRALAQAVRQVHPQVRVIYMTGYSDQKFGSTEEVLGKPFSPAALKHAMERPAGPSRA